ncbi:hypothetical protein ACQ4N7_01140 [Nodosilinea sp. AN01ver1]|uniref:hypothetical protein n=1 Tax=Nodosilinea sp. AN01ver1 TaxID=3423362 RepID=UPI003D32192E
MLHEFKGRRHDMDTPDEAKEFEKVVKAETGATQATYQGVDAQTLRTVVSTDSATVYADVDYDGNISIEDVVPHSREGEGDA